MTPPSSSSPRLRRPSCPTTRPAPVATRPHFRHASTKPRWPTSTIATAPRPSYWSSAITLQPVCWSRRSRADSTSGSPSTTRVSCMRSSVSAQQSQPTRSLAASPSGRPSSVPLTTGSSLWRRLVRATKFGSLSSTIARTSSDARPRLIANCWPRSAATLSSQERSTSMPSLLWPTST